MADTDRLAQLIREAREMGQDVLPPDVNLSTKEFTVEKGKIVFGLLGIKNVGAGAVDAIIAERELHGPFASFTDFFDRIDSHEVNRKGRPRRSSSPALRPVWERRAPSLMKNLERSDLDASAKAREANDTARCLSFEGVADAPVAAVDLERCPSCPRRSSSQEEDRTSASFSPGASPRQWKRPSSSVR